jgi:oligoendopeptidase F
VSQEWKELGADKIRTFAESPLLAAYRNDLLESADNIQYLLSEEVERALTKKSRAMGILGLHEELRSSFTFPWTEEDGTQKQLTEEEIRSFAKHPNRDLRKKASESMQSVYLVHQNQITFGNLYTSIVKNWSSSMELRGYKGVMSKRNISEQLSDTVVDTLMSRVQEYFPLYQRFLRAKQKHLGVSELHGYDTGAPIHLIQKKVPYKEAQKQVLEMFGAFDSRFHDYARAMMEEGRVDVFPKAGKRGGAFASYDKGVESFVLLNYTDTIDDVFTLAHELGHAIH